MVNQGILPPRFAVPGLGQVINLTSGFMYNFEFLFFWGPFAPFKDGYQLRPEFKVFSKRADLTKEISKSILFLGLFNLVLAPLIFVWQLLQFVYNHTEVSRPLFFRLRIKLSLSENMYRKTCIFASLFLRAFINEFIQVIFPSMIRFIYSLLVAIKLYYYDI